MIGVLLKGNILPLCLSLKSEGVPWNTIIKDGKSPRFVELLPPCRAERSRSQGGLGWVNKMLMRFCFQIYRTPSVYP